MEDAESQVRAVLFAYHRPVAIRWARLIFRHLNVVVNRPKAKAKSGEALRLVITANSSAPRDPFVRGTYGWISSRRGEPESGLLYLLSGC